jgi:hypothetical protein
LADGEPITLTSHFYDDNYGSSSFDEIETLKFADGSTINLKGSLTFTGTVLPDAMYGTSLADRPQLLQQNVLAPARKHAMNNGKSPTITHPVL